LDPFTLIAGGSSLIGGLISSIGAKKAAKKQAAAIKEGLNEYNASADAATGQVNTGADRALGFVQPYVDAGRSGLDLYKAAIGASGREAQQGFYDDFIDDPGFQHALEQGQRAVEHSRIFRGSSLSGAAKKELFAHGEGMRLGAYRDRLAQLSSLSQIGLQAGTTGANIETSRGSNLAQIAIGKGDAALRARTGIGAAQASGITGMTNAATSTLTNLASLGLRRPMESTGIGGGQAGGFMSSNPLPRAA
jgi:hypothetical protein